MDKLALSTAYVAADDSDCLELQRRIADIGKSVAAIHADEVDRRARFPHESIEALRKLRALGAAVPRQLGGHGCTIAQLCSHCETLGQYCSATAMILAMHSIQVACIARHAGNSTYLRNYLSEIAERQLLIGSVTSEVGVGGDLRSSKTSVLPDGINFSLRKAATTISYGAQADGLLVTARRTPNAVAGDQVLVVVHSSDTVLEQTSEWDTLGMRGTCSPGYNLQSRGSAEQIFPAPFAEIVTETMVPYSHLLWCSLWSGIAKGALTRTGAFVRAAARKAPDSIPPTALRLAEVSSEFQALDQNVRSMCRQFELIDASSNVVDTLSSFGFALQINNLKLSTSQVSARIVQRCLEICGIAGYRNDSPYSMGRSLRDALSASVMIGNDRILATNAAMLLVHKDV